MEMKDIQKFIDDNNARIIYNPANTGTIISENFAILWTPPNIINPVKAASVNPTKSLFIPNTLLKAAAIVFAWTALNTKAKHIVISTANVRAIPLLFKPCSI